MWTWHLDEVHAGTVWGYSYDIHGIYGVEVGYLGNGTFRKFFLGAHLFPLHPSNRISLIRALFYYNLYYVLSEHHHLFI